MREIASIHPRVLLEGPYLSLPWRCWVVSRGRRARLPALENLPRQGGRGSSGHGER